MGGEDGGNSGGWGDGGIRVTAGDGGRETLRIFNQSKIRPIQISLMVNMLLYAFMFFAMFLYEVQILAHNRC